MDTIRRCALGLGLAVAATVTLAGCSQQPKVIRIAVAGPMSGPNAVFGREQLNGARLAVEQANANGGVLGLPIEIQEIDDKADTEETGRLALEIGSDHSVLAVIGHPNSGPALLASDVYDQYKVPFVITVATNPKITNRGNTFTFRICPTDEMQGPLAAEYAFSKLGKKTIAILHDGSTYGKGASEEFGKRADSEGANIVLLEIAPRGQTDFGSLVAKLAEVKPDVIFFAGMFTEAADLLKEGRAKGVESIFMATDGVFDTAFIRNAGAASEGAYVTFLAPPWEEVPSAAAFVAAFSKKYGEVGPLCPYGYDAMNVVLEGVRRAGKAQRQAVQMALANPSFKLQGATGEISFDEDRQLKGGQFHLYQVKAGRFVPVATQ